MALFVAPVTLPNARRPHNAAARARFNTMCTPKSNKVRKVREPAASAPKPPSAPDSEPSKPSSSGETQAPNLLGALIADFMDGVRKMLAPGDESVHVLRVRSPVPLRVALASGVRDIVEGETLLQFRDERSAVRTAWLVQDAAVAQRVAVSDVALTVALVRNASVAGERPVPQRPHEDTDPAYFLPYALPPDEDDLNDWMRSVHWEDCAHTRFICDNTPAPGEDNKLDDEWKQTVGKLTYLEVEQVDEQCRLCGGSGLCRCTRCGGAAAMAYPGSSFRCVCRNGVVPCCWCAGDGIPR